MGATQRSLNAAVRDFSIVQKISVVVDEATSPNVGDSLPRPLRVPTVVFRTLLSDAV
jgi:hypothetical protein